VRQSGSHAALIVVPRLVAQLSSTLGTVPIGNEIWDDTAIVLPSSMTHLSWKNLFTRQILSTCQQSSINVSEILRQFPVALLEAVPVQKPVSS
jgi:maltooligosyltrehalose synthase